MNVLCLVYVSIPVLNLIHKQKEGRILGALEVLPIQTVTYIGAKVSELWNWCSGPAWKNGAMQMFFFGCENLKWDNKIIKRKENFKVFTKTQNFKGEKREITSEI